LEPSGPLPPIETERALMLANRLWAAEKNRETIAPLSETEADITVEAAYTIQRVGLGLRGAPGQGWKLGYTSRAMREQMNVNEPNLGVLTRDHLQSADTGVLDAASLVHPMAEPEIAILVGHTLAGPGVGRSDAWRAADAAAPAIEVVDTRYHAYKFTLTDNIADNSSSARVVLGPWASRSTLPDLRTVGVELWARGQVLARGTGGEVLGDPYLALAWLANFLGAKGECIPAGSIVMTGGITRAFPLAAGDTLLAEFASLGLARLYMNGAPPD